MSDPFVQRYEYDYLKEIIKDLENKIVELEMKIKLLETFSGLKEVTRKTDPSHGGKIYDVKD